MTRDDLCEMLSEQTPACGPAREALLSGGAFDVWECLVPVGQLFHTYRVRHRVAQRHGQPTLGLDETLGILDAAEDEVLRIGSIRTGDGHWAFVLFFNAAATTCWPALASPGPRTTDTDRSRTPSGPTTTLSGQLER